MNDRQRSTTFSEAPPPTSEHSASSVPGGSRGRVFFFVVGLLFDVGLVQWIAGLGRIPDWHPASPFGFLLVCGIPVLIAFSIGWDMRARVHR